MGDGERGDIAFGDFRVLPSRRLLLFENRPVRLGSRAFDLLMALLDRPGELVRKDELIARAWPDTFVDETNLRVHIAALRKALGETRGEARYLLNDPGRGYRFVGRIDAVPADDAAAPLALQARISALPAPLIRVVGRDAAVRMLEQRLAQSRLVSLVGPPGMGKSTVAAVLAERLAGEFRDGVCFVDLSLLSDGALVASAVASALDLPVHSRVPLGEITGQLTVRQMLLVLDGCEAVVDAVATLCEAVLRMTTGITLVVTSHEPLRIDGERVTRLPALDVPDATEGLSPHDALAHSAVELFVERASAIVDGFELTPEEVSVVVDICRRLDGLPLAIELAAGRIDAFGVRGVADLLGDRFRLLTDGRRSALPRHQTLLAALDWSHDLLDDRQAATFRRLGVFVGGFHLEAAVEVAADASLDRQAVLDAIANLVAKSLLAADVSGETTIYRMLDSTRAYALNKLQASGDARAAAERHARHYKSELDKIEGDWLDRPDGDGLTALRQIVDNVRAALDWAASPAGDPGLAAATTAASVILWMRLSLTDECLTRVERALPLLGTGEDEETLRCRMRLEAALGLSLMFTRGHLAETSAALERTFLLAERLSDREYALRALWGMWVGRLNNGAIPSALELARRFGDIASTSTDPLDTVIADRMLGFSYHFLGNNREARVHLEQMVRRNDGEGVRSHLYRFQFDQWVTARATLAESLWIQGFADQALEAARESARRALLIGHGVTTCNTLAKASAVALHAGDLALAEEMVAGLLQTASEHLLTFWRSEGRCLEGVCRIRRGDLAGGLAELRTELRGFPGNSLTVRYIGYLGELADALSRAGEHASAAEAIDEALARSERNSERWCVAELLRIRAELARRSPGPSEPGPEELFRQSLDWARRQDALAWELRTALGYASLLRDTGRSTEAFELLAGIRGRFTEGFATADLVAADALMAVLRT